jgi:hypothetical protein
VTLGRLSALEAKAQLSHSQVQGLGGNGSAYIKESTCFKRFDFQRKDSLFFEKIFKAARFRQHVPNNRCYNRFCKSVQSVGALRLLEAEGEQL